MAAAELSGPLQALVVLDFELTLDNMTAADVQLGRRGEAVSSTTRNQSSSELPMGGMEKRDPPRPNRDEGPYLASEGPPQLREGLPRTYTVFFIIKNIRNHHLTDNPCWSSEEPPQLPSLSSVTDVI